MSFFPVSYTHLDVYKRQPESSGISEKRKRTMDDEVRKQIFEDFKKMITTESVVGPVSYTHLDVYKRQGSGRPVCW